MYLKAQVKGHALHPIFVAFPIVFYTVTPLCFAVFMWINRDPFWFQAGKYCAMAGVVSAVVAAIPGTLDWAFGIPRNTAAKKRGLIHMVLNVTALALFGVSVFLLRDSAPAASSTVATVFSLTLAAVVLTGFAGYHGWELIASHKVGVRLSEAQERLEPIEQMKPTAHDPQHYRKGA